MILTTHLLTGAAIVLNIQPLPSTFALAFLSHYFLDFLFHRDYTIEYIRARLWQKAFFDFLRIALDISFGVLLIVILSKNLSIALLGGFIAILPDGLTLLFLIFPKSRLLEKFYNFHCKKVHFFAKKKISLFWEIFSQALVILIAIYFLQLP